MAQKKENLITALYERLSRDDELQGKEGSHGCSQGSNPSGGPGKWGILSAECG